MKLTNIYELVIVSRQRLFLFFWIAYVPYIYIIIPWGLVITKCSWHPINRNTYWPIWMGKLFIFLCNKWGWSMARGLGLTEIYSKMAGIDVRYWHQTSEIPWSWTPIIYRISWFSIDGHYWSGADPSVMLYILGHTAQIIEGAGNCVWPLSETSGKLVC